MFLLNVNLIFLFYTDIKNLIYSEIYLPSLFYLIKLNINLTNNTQTHKQISINTDPPKNPSKDIIIQ